MHKKQRLFLAYIIMKKIQISTDRILLIIILMLLWYSTLIKACESDVDISLQPNVTMVNDKIYTMEINNSGRKSNIKAISTSY